MKRSYSSVIRSITSYLVPLTLCLFFLSGCGLTLKEIKKIDVSMAAYMGVDEITADCRAGMAKADMDVSPDPVSVRRVEAVLEYANEDSEDFQKCYSGMAWIYYVAAKAEGAVRSWAKKLVELGVLVP